MRRYLVVHHPDMSQPLCVHHLLKNYHWESIDAEHVLVLADIDPRHLDALEAHPSVLLAPSIYSEETLKVHAAQTDAQPHYLKLKQCLGVTSQHTTIDLATSAVKRFGAKMALDL
jgi:hypothetical protein